MAAIVWDVLWCQTKVNQEYFISFLGFFAGTSKDDILRFYVSVDESTWMDTFNSVHLIKKIFIEKPIFGEMFTIYMPMLQTTETDNVLNLLRKVSRF